MTIRRLAWVAVGAALALAGCADPEEVADDAPLPDAATIVCDASGTTVETPSVRPRLDGLHVVIDNRLDVDPGFAFRFDDGAGGGDNAPPGLSDHTLQAPPGTLEIGCYPDDKALGEPDLEELEVVDEGAIYRSVRLDCESVVGQISDYGQDAPGAQGDPVELARTDFESALDGGLEQDDVVERAGYPESDLPIVRLVRDDQVVATVEYRGADDGGWLEDTLSKCEDLAPSS